LMQEMYALPIITVRLMNFTITVIGEVTRPGKISIVGDNINLLQALSLAGDMTVYGKRDDVVLIRQTPDGGYLRASLDISREDIISSPFFFLQQNDELYVKPNNARAQAADIGPRLNVILGISSFMMTLVTFALMLSKK